MNERLGMIDILRIIAVLFIFLFHSNIHINCNYSILTPFINMGAIFMTAFFLISGFSIYYVNFEKNSFDTKDQIVTFYKKRIISVMPMYWVIAITYPIWDIIVNKGSILENIVLAPIEILGLQSIFSSLFSYTHNNGTWFVSCILLCYIVYPFVYKLIKEINIKTKKICVIALAHILVYSSFLVEFLKINNIYSNPYFRILEFVIGMILCSIWFEIKENKWYKKYIARRAFFWGMFLILIVFVTLLVKKNMLVGNYMVYNIIGLPSFVAIIFSGAGIETPIINSSRLVRYAVKISYVFFFAQFYIWKITSEIIRIIGKDMNILRVVISLVLCITIAIVMHEIIEKPLKKVLSKRILNN